MLGLPEVASVATSLVVKVVSAVGVGLGGYKMLMQGLNLLGNGIKEGAEFDPIETVVGLALFGIGCAGWWVADKIATMGSPHMQRAESSRLNGMLAQQSR